MSLAGSRANPYRRWSALAVPAIRQRSSPAQRKFKRNWVGNRSVRIWSALFQTHGNGIGATLMVTMTRPSQHSRQWIKHRVGSAAQDLSNHDDNENNAEDENEPAFLALYPSALLAGLLQPCPGG